MRKEVPIWEKSNLTLEEVAGMETAASLELIRQKPETASANYL